MIRKNTSTSMYLQIADVLRHEIVAQKYAPGSSLGTQSELARRFGVSLITIKKALEILERDNMIVAKQGKGTFVQDALLQESGGNLKALTAVFKKQNLCPQISVREMKEIPTPRSLPESVLKYMGKTCIYAERIHSVDNKEICYTKIYIPLELGRLLSREELSQDSIYHISQTKLGIRLGHAIQAIHAGKADSDIAGALKIKPADPILIVERESYREDGRLLEFGIRYFEASMYSFRVELDISGD